MRAQRELNLKSTIEKIKRNECYYKATVQRLSEKLDYTRKKSEERQKWMDEVESKIELAPFSHVIYTYYT